MNPFSVRTVRILSRTLLTLLALCGALYFASYFYVVQSFNGNAEFPVECAVVFGAAVSRGSQAGPAIVRRVGEAARLYREGQVDRLILTGGKGEGNRKTEAEVMREQALLGNVRAEDIVLEDQARSTWENLLYAKNLTSDCSSVVAISDQYHLGRIRLLAARQGWRGLQLWPAQDHDPVGTEEKGFLREVIAVLYYGLFLDAVMPLAPVSDT
jgi:uncharacterized SAM-binding protein YcdF (DUF218 family)